jgi:hypothetical protein
MTGFIRSRSTAIVYDEQETPTPSPVRTSLQKPQSPRWEPFNGPLAWIPCSDRTSEAIGNDMRSTDRQPCSIQNT